MTATAANLTPGDSPGANYCSAQVSEFLGALDEAIRLQEAALGRLRGLPDAVMARDEDAVRRILAEADAASEQFAALAQAREVAKGRLAAAVACPPEEVTLSWLLGRVPAAEAEAIEARRRRIAALVGDIRRQHRRTAAFLGECAHLNHAFLTGLFPDMESVKTYGHRGRRGDRAGTGLLDARS